MRRKRYSEKLEWFEQEIDFIQKHRMDDEVSRRAVFYSIQTAVEVVMDIVAMLDKDMGMEVEDDYTNIQKLESEGIITREEGELLKCSMV